MGGGGIRAAEVEVVVVVVPGVAGYCYLSGDIERGPSTSGRWPGAAARPSDRGRHTGLASSLSWATGGSGRNILKSQADENRILCYLVRIA